MRNKVVLFLSAGVVALAQFGQQQNLAHKIDFPHDAPISLAGDEWGGSAATVRGGAYAIDVRVALSLRNASQRRIRGITSPFSPRKRLPAAKAPSPCPAWTSPPAKHFRCAAICTCCAPSAPASSPMVEVSLDGVLFDDLNFTAPTNCIRRRTMMVWELEARRDRQFFKALLDQSGRDGLQKEMLSSLARGDRPQYGVEMVRGRATNTDGEHDMQFAFLQFPDAPIEPMGGIAHIAGNEARAPKLVVHNRSPRVIRYLEMGWIVRDSQGHEFLAASMPSEMRLPPSSSSQILPDASLRFDSRTSVESMTGFVSSVEFSDGTMWIPNRTELDDPVLRRVVGPSPEEQRLVQIYRKRGIGAVIDELKKF